MTAMIQLISPVDGRVYAERRRTEAAQIEQALAAACAAQAQWRRRPLSERAACCSAAVDSMLAMSAEIVPELAWQMGRPVRFGAGELRGFEERARHMIAIAPEALAAVAPAPLAGFRRHIKREPVGTVLVIAPWNYPYLTAVNSIIPALMAGNSVILKHATQTLLVGERFAEAFRRANLPEGLFHNLLLDHGQTAAIIASGSVQQVNFTGSVGAGKAMEVAAMGRFLGLGLELGGKDPAYVRADANLEHAVENLVDGAFYNAGQSCCAVERIYVMRPLFSRFVDAYVAEVEKYKVGHPEDEATTMGPLAQRKAVDSMEFQVRQAVDRGAKVLTGGTRLPGPGYYFQPTVLIDVDHGMSVMTEESFGPVIGIMPVDDDEGAVRLMNDSPYGLTASIWTADMARGEALANRTAAGTVYVNRCDYLDPELAWVGIQDSGHGCTLSHLGYRYLTRPKSFHIRTRT